MVESIGNAALKRAGMCVFVSTTVASSVTVSCAVRLLAGAFTTLICTTCCSYREPFNAANLTE